MKNDSKKQKAEGQTVSPPIEGIGHKVDYTVRENANLDKKQIREWLLKDVKNVYILLAEVINSNECLDALTDVFWKRYQAFHKQKNEEHATNG